MQFCARKDGKENQDFTSPSFLHTILQESYHFYNIYDNKINDIHFLRKSLIARNAATPIISVL